MAKKMKKYYCSLSIDNQCQYGGNKTYDYGFLTGTGEYCRVVNKWVMYLKECPLNNISEKAGKK
jgi:hypothetical protein